MKGEKPMINKKVMLMAAVGAAMASCGINPEKIVKSQHGFEPTTPNWKVKQSEEDKNLKLQKAEEKRKRKAERKLNGIKS